MKSKIRRLRVFSDIARPLIKHKKSFPPAWVRRTQNADGKGHYCCLKKGAVNKGYPYCFFKTDLKSAYLYPWPLYFRLRICICDVGEKQKGHRQGRPIDRTIVSYLAGGLSRMSGITTGSCSGGCPRSSDLEADLARPCFSSTVPS